MNRSIPSSTFVILCIATLSISLAPAMQAQDSNCSTAEAAGDWGFTLIGTLLTPNGTVPAAAIARGTFDTHGNVTSAVEFRNVGGGFAKEVLTGSWTRGFRLYPARAVYKATCFQKCARLVCLITGDLETSANE